MRKGRIKPLKLRLSQVVSVLSTKPVFSSTVEELVKTPPTGVRNAVEAPQGLNQGGDMKN